MKYTVLAQKCVAFLAIMISHLNKQVCIRILIQYIQCGLHDDKGESLLSINLK